MSASMTKKLRVKPLASETLMERLARQYAQLRRGERRLEEERKETGQRLLPLMQDERQQKQKVDLDPDTVATVSVKQRETLTIDEDRLKKAIGAPAYNKLTTPVLDEAKVEAAIQLGELDPNVVASCTSEFRTDYLEVRFTKSKRRANDG